MARIPVSPSHDPATPSSGEQAAARPGLPLTRMPRRRSAEGGDHTWPRVSVVIPAMNEARNLPHVLEQLDDVWEIVVVDGNSTDDTVAVVRSVAPRARVLTQPGRGKGDALIHGFHHARGDIIVTLDADGSADPAEIPLFVGALLAGADFTKGSRHAVGGGSEDLTTLRRTGNRVLGAIVNVLYRTRYTDLCYGYNAFWRDCLPQLDVDCHGFEVETLMNVRAAKAGLRVSEVPSFERSRVHGVSNLNAMRDGWRVLRTIVRERVTAAERAQPDPDRFANRMRTPQFERVG